MSENPARTILSGLSLFVDLTPAQLEGVVHTFDEATFGEDERILRQGFGGSNFYVILEGDAEVRIDGEVRRSLARGDFFGEISALLDEPPTADVVALSPLRCLVLAAGDLRSFLMKHPSVSYRLLQAEARRLSDTAR